MSAALTASVAAFKASRRLDGKRVSIKISDSLTLTNVHVLPGETQRQLLGEDNELISDRVQDWLVLVTDYQGYEPKKSHQIILGSETFDLAEMDDDKFFRFHDPPHNKIYRIHSVLTTGEAG